jgi:hypothetical protein
MVVEKPGIMNLVIKVRSISWWKYFPEESKMTPIFITPNPDGATSGFVTTLILIIL